MEIIYKGGRWLVNGKRLQDLSKAEMDFLDSFFRIVKQVKSENHEDVRFYKQKSPAQTEL